MTDQPEPKYVAFEHLPLEEQAEVRKEIYGPVLGQFVHDLETGKVEGDVVALGPDDEPPED